jgi:hypothetical protein
MLAQLRRLVASRPWVPLLALEGVLALSFVALAIHWVVAGRHPLPPTAVPTWSAPAPGPAGGATPIPRDPRGSPTPTARPGPGALGKDLPPDILDRLSGDARTRYLNEWSVVRRLTRAVEQYLAGRVLPPITKRGRTDGPTPAAH